MLCAARDAFSRVRQLLRDMGKRAGVFSVHRLSTRVVLVFAGTDIEPAAQTSLLDRSLQSRGVLLAGVPGGLPCFSVLSFVFADVTFVCQLVATMRSSLLCSHLMLCVTSNRCGAHSAQAHHQTVRAPVRVCQSRGCSWTWTEALLDCECNTRTLNAVSLVMLIRCCVDRE